MTWKMKLPFKTRIVDKGSFSPNSLPVPRLYRELPLYNTLRRLAASHH